MSVWRVPVGSSGSLYRDSYDGPLAPSGDAPAAAAAPLLLECPPPPPSAAAVVSKEECMCPSSTLKKKTKHTAHTQCGQGMEATNVWQVRAIARLSRWAWILLYHDLNQLKSKVKVVPSPALSGCAWHSEQQLLYVHCTTSYSEKTERRNCVGSRAAVEGTVVSLLTQA